jgi:hypothetical protein
MAPDTLLYALLAGLASSAFVAWVGLLSDGPEGWPARRVFALAAASLTGLLVLFAGLLAGWW